jgi:hypothetical protein
VVGEGATEFEDIEEGGMGEGEGVKDVSDQIENEDQVRDCIKAVNKFNLFIVENFFYILHLTGLLCK